MVVGAEPRQRKRGHASTRQVEDPLIHIQNSAAKLIGPLSDEREACFAAQCIGCPIGLIGEGDEQTPVLGIRSDVFDEK